MLCKDTLIKIAKNEATVRMVTGNAVVVMLCALHNLTFRVEDRMLNKFATNADDLPNAVSHKLLLLFASRGTDPKAFASI